MRHCSPESILLTLLLLGCVSAHGQEDPLLISGARLFIGDGTVLEDGAVLLQDGLVVQVGPAAEIQPPAAAQRLDAAGKTILPALIDAHAHLGYQGRDGWGAQHYSEANLIDNLQQYAWYGFGAVFSAGSDPAGLVARWQQEAVADGARLLYAAGMALPGQGPNDRFLEHVLALERTTGMTVLWGVQDPQQAREQVRAVAAEGVDFIKIWVDDRAGSQQKLPASVYRAVIDEAAGLGLRVFAHQQYAGDMPELLRAGAQGFLHGRLGVAFDEEIVRQTREAGAFVVPNLGLGELRGEGIGADPFLNEIMSPAMAAALAPGVNGRRRQIELNPAREAELGASLTGLAEAGVDIVLGTDAGAIPDHPFGYAGHRELEIYVRLGLTPGQALMAATSVAARHLGLDDMGLLRAGYSADLLVLDADPLEDIRNTRRIHAVYLRGRAVDREALRARWAGL